MKKYFLNIILLSLIILCFNFPLANWGAFIAVLAVFYAIILNKTKFNTYTLIISTTVVFSLICIKINLYNENIHMGEQIYSPDDKYLEKYLPNKISNLAKNEWGKLNKPFESYPNNTKQTNNPWAFSTDAFFDNPKMTRTIKNINFKDRFDLRVGVLNNAKFNYFGNNLGSSGAYYPLIFSFLLPNTFIDEQLCWTGKILIEKNNQWVEYSSQENKCILLDSSYWKNNKYLKLYALDFDENYQLAIQINNNKHTLIYLLSIFSAIIIILLLTNLNRYDFTLIGLSVSCILIYMADQYFRGGHPSSFSGMPYMGRGNDGLTHYSFARDMVEALYNNNIREWFRGSEDIFYMMPGMRYLLATSMIFFGESIFGLLIIISLTPLVIRSLLQRIFNKKWELIMLSCFFIIPIFEPFSFFQIYLAKYTIEGFGAGIAIVSLISAFSLLWKEDNNTYTNIELLKAGLCLAIAISLRPNFLPAIIILLSGLSLNFAYTNNLTKVIPLSIGFSPILLVTYHNFFFGNKFVPITNSATIGNNMRNSPEKWLECFNLVPNACNDIYNHIGIWVSYTEPWYIFIIGCLLFIIFSKKLSFKNKIFAFSLICGHLVFLFYEGVARYSHGIWLTSFILCLPLIKEGMTNAYKKYSISKNNESVV